ncbi:MAG: TonB-dependent receptor [Crocinitomicaceae bacterium]|nr:TonB-dependent receptor [Crocinitomicaceae bacterium]
MKQLLLILSLVYTLLSNAQTYQGKVVHHQDHERSIPFAKLYFIDLGSTIYADSTGFWEISDAPAGTNHVIVSAVGFETIHTDIELVEGQLILIELSETHHDLDKVIVSNNGWLHRESITNVESQPLSELNKIPNSTLGEAIANIPGVYQSGIGAGLAKPVIRGLSGSRVVTYLNSLRIENQQWGGDHGLPVTSLGIGSVEVIKGPSSLLFGADAMGGVLYFVDEPYAERNTMSGFVSSKFEHNSLGTSNQAGFRISKNAIRLNLYGGYDNSADYGIPNGNQILNSRFKQSSAKVALGYNKKKWVLNVRYNFYQGRLGLPGHTHDSIIDASSFQTTTQNRKDNIPAQFVTNHFTSVENKFFLGKHELYITLGNTNNALKEFEEKFTIPEMVINLNNSVYNAKWKIHFNKVFELIVGSQGMYQINKNDPAAEEELIPDAKTLDVGGFALLHAKWKEWRIQTGARYDNRTINTSGSSSFSGSYQGVNFSSGFAWIHERSTLRFNVSSGYRAPTTSELLSDGIHHGSARYEIGNTTLGSEKAIQIDLSYGLHLEDFELIINPFFNQIYDYIYLQPNDSVIDGFKVYNYVQSPVSILYGTDAGFHYHPHGAHWMHLESSFSTLFAEDNNKQPLPMIPQSRINSQLRFEFNMKGVFKIEDIVIQHSYYFKQNRLVDYETFTAAYNLLNLGLNMKFDLQTPIYLGMGVRNVLNETYYDHLSTLKYLAIPNAGINAYFSVRIEFNKTLKKH